MRKLLLILMIACTVQASGQKKIKAGIIYKEHPYIETVRRLARLYEQGDAEALVKMYADTAKIYGMTRYSVDTSVVAQLSVPPSKSLAEAKAGWKHVFENWEHIKMREIGEASGLEYTHSPFTVQSFWLFTLVNRKTKKVAKVEMVLFAQFNKAGKIGTQIEFYDPASLIAASK